MKKLIIAAITICLLMVSCNSAEGESVTSGEGSETSSVSELDESSVESSEESSEQSEDEDESEESESVPSDGSIINNYADVTTASIMKISENGVSNENIEIVFPSFAGVELTEIIMDGTPSLEWIDENNNSINSSKELFSFGSRIPSEEEYINDYSAESLETDTAIIEEIETEFNDIIEKLGIDTMPKLVIYKLYNEDKTDYIHSAKIYASLEKENINNNVIKTSSSDMGRGVGIGFAEYKDGEFDFIFLPGAYVFESVEDVAITSSQDALDLYENQGKDIIGFESGTNPSPFAGGKTAEEAAEEIFGDRLDEFSEEEYNELIESYNEVIEMEREAQELIDNAQKYIELKYYTRPCSDDPENLELAPYWEIFYVNENNLEIPLDMYDAITGNKLFFELMAY